VTGLRRAFAAAALLAATAFGVALPTTPAAAATTASCAQVHLGPQASADAAESYFTVDAAPGTTVTEHLVAANPTNSTCSVALARAFGRTATNSGDTYAASTAGRCVSTACWVTGLPTSVAVAPGRRVVVPFQVHVPASATAGQYLAGVVGEPTMKSGSAATSTGVAVHIANRVAIGVAVTVPGALQPRVAIPAVTVDADASVLSAKLEVRERNTGNTWEHPVGAITVRVGDRTVRIPMTSNTLLAGDTATLTAGISGVPAGTYDTTARLTYATGAKTAVWHGSVTFPAPPQVTRSGQIIRVVDAGTPTWVFGTIGGLALLLVVVIVLLVLALRRRRREPSLR
jgi:hypothetical protein